MIRISFSVFPVTFFLVSLFSCTGEDSEKSTRIEFNQPDSIRQTMSLDNSELVARISVNFESFQEFTIRPGGSTVTVTVSGVIPNEENSLVIWWSEILEGYPVELSVQSQRFMADGSTIIDQRHDHAQYDYDGDGMSNLDERLSGTCVWSDTESCNTPGQPTGNVLLNGDFSSGNDYWWPNNISTQNGELCVATPTPTSSVLQLGYDRRFRIEGRSRYKITFDAKSQANSTVTVLLLLPNSNGATLFEETVEVNAAYGRNTVFFNNSNNAWDEVAIAFVLGDRTENNYCVDNISIVNDTSG